MTTGAIVWMVIFGLSAAGFFAVAAVVSVLGVRDVGDLLGWSRTARLKE